MKNIITIQLGNCGNALGSKYWEEICSEHGVTPANGVWCGEHDIQHHKITSVFNYGAGTNNYVPRCVLVDLDPTSLEACRCSPIGQVFRPDNFVFGRIGAGNNFARGHFTEGVDIRDLTLEVIRKEVELSEMNSGFQMIHSIGGGSGAGMGSLLLEMLKDEYPKRLMMNFTVMPSAKVSDTVVEPINATLACPALIKHSDMTVCLDNESVYDICQKVLRLDALMYYDLNNVMAKVMTGLSASYRFPSVHHVGWRSLKCLMVPTPKTHFFVPGFAPLNSRGVHPYRKFSVQDITYQLLNGNVFMGNIKKNVGKYISALAYFRGINVEEQEVTDILANFEAKNSSHFVDWMPYHFVKSFCNTPPKGMKISATFLANHTASVDSWERVLNTYKKMFKRKAFIHWYYAEGMGEDDFKQAEEEVNELLSEYRKCEQGPPQGWNTKDSNNNAVFKCMKEDEQVAGGPPVAVEPNFPICP